MIALIHSPLTGPFVWGGVARELEGRGERVVVPRMAVGADADWRPLVDAARLALSGTGQLTMVAHSGAGLLLPAIARDLDVARLVFVDARLPPSSGSAAIAEGQFLAFVRSLATTDGRLPPWSRWWGAAPLRTMLPNDALLREVEADMPRVPVAYMEGQVDVPEGWEDLRCEYVRFSVAYLMEEAEARRRAWPVTFLPGGHLHMVVDPHAVAGALIEARDAA